MRRLYRHRDEVHELVRTEARVALEKCFDNKAVFGWQDDVCDQIFGAVCKLQTLTVEKLKRVREGYELEEDCISLLGCLTYAWDKSYSYHERYARTQFPLSFARQFELMDGAVDMVRSFPPWLCSRNAPAQPRPQSSRSSRFAGCRQRSTAARRTGRTSSA